MKSYANPYEARTAVRPVPVTFHATPTRGDRFHHCGFIPEFPDGNPGSPGNSRPAGAFVNTVLLTPLRKLSRLKLEIAPFFTFCPKNGSHRRPAFTVTRFVALHASCA